MHKFTKALVASALLLTAIGCGDGKLTAAAAEESIRRHQAFPSELPIEIQGISQADGAREAIVRTKLGESTLNLKLRQFDTGWTWEAAETKGGTWIDAATATAQVIEEARRERALAWAKPPLDEYRRTADAMSWYFNSLPSGTSMGLAEGWLFMREVGIRGAQIGNWSAEERKERIKRYSEPAIDVWGSEVVMDFDEGKRIATFVSAGPDKAPGTPDDLLVTAVGRKSWSEMDNRIIWEYNRTWLLPEGLEEAISKYREPGDTIQTSRIN